MVDMRFGHQVSRLITDQTAVCPILYHLHLHALTLFAYSYVWCAVEPTILISDSAPACLVSQLQGVAVSEFFRFAHVSLL
jgi:hypothetical protein